ncbi:uncharacterized protein L201_004787 [Kwoniella dendrophila CBS 6074]|uniref:Sugar phosphate transporter domain-containing protein n=1 Tax=Kwoniella dendrophila CBS 6074 TaxID=1295534 RepID=A0AAX4JYC4_9TREE
MNQNDSLAGPSRSSHSTSTPYNVSSNSSSSSLKGKNNSSLNDTDYPPRYNDDVDHSDIKNKRRNSNDENSEEEEQGLIYARQNEMEDNVGIVGIEPGHEIHRHATLEMKKALWWKNVIITGIFILSWYTFATLLSLYNKWMFSPDYYGFSYPLFVTCCHMVVQFGLAAIIRNAFADKFRPKERPTRKEYITKILPTAASTGGDIGLSNLSLKTITLSLYTMCKSSTLIFVLLFAFTFKLEKYSLRLISVITLISFGVFCMVFNTTSVSIPGIIMVFTASGLGGLRWALTELVMHKKSMGLSNPFATIYWLAPLMAITLALVSMVVENWFTIFQTDFFQGIQTIKTICVIVLPGTLAFAMVASEYFIIQRAGVVPLSIAGIFKEVSTISISAWVFGDQLTGLNIVGVAITICGIALYSYHKYQKSMASTVELDSNGKPILDEDGTSPLIRSQANRYIQTPQNEHNDHYYENDQLNPTNNESEVPLTKLRNSNKNIEENDEDRTQRLRDDSEGWDNNTPNDDWSEEEEDDIDEDEIQKRRNERLNSNSNSNSNSSTGQGKLDRKSSWGDWWDKEL